MHSLLAKTNPNRTNYLVNRKSNGYYEKDGSYGKEIDSKTCQEEWNSAVPFCLYMIAILSEFICLQVQNVIIIITTIITWTMHMHA